MSWIDRVACPELYIEAYESAVCGLDVTDETLDETMEFIAQELVAEAEDIESLFSEWYPELEALADSEAYLTIDYDRFLDELKVMYSVGFDRYERIYLFNA